MAKFNRLLALLSLALLCSLSSFAQQRFDPTVLKQVEQESSTWMFMYNNTLYMGHRENKAFFEQEQGGNFLLGYRRAHRQKVVADVTLATGGFISAIGIGLLLERQHRRDGWLALGTGAIIGGIGKLIERGADRKINKVIKQFNDARGGLGITTGYQQQQLLAGLRVRL